MTNDTADRLHLEEGERVIGVLHVQELDNGDKLITTYRDEWVDFPKRPPVDLEPELWSQVTEMIDQWLETDLDCFIGNAELGLVGPGPKSPLGRLLLDYLKARKHAPHWSPKVKGHNNHRFIPPEVLASLGKPKPAKRTTSSAKKPAIPLPKLGTCEWCGATFTMKRSTARFCPKPGCKKAAQRARGRK